MPQAPENPMDHMFAEGRALLAELAQMEAEVERLHLRIEALGAEISQFGRLFLGNDRAKDPV